MDTFVTGYISGIISIIAVYIFIQSVRGRKTGSSDSLEGRIDKNNTDIRSGFDRSEEELNRARAVNTGLGNINKEAIESIAATNRTVSEIIAAAKRKRRKGD